MRIEINGGPHVVVSSVESPEGDVVVFDVGLSPQLTKLLDKLEAEGIEGIRGPRGYRGPIGYNGADGISGPMGPPGESALTGIWQGIRRVMHRLCTG